MLPFEGGISGSENGTLIFAVLLALFYLFYAPGHMAPLKVTAKTLSVTLLAGLSSMAGGPWLLTLALMLCAAGDFFLAIEDFDKRFFLAGLVAFLAGHIACVVLFLALPASAAPLPLPALILIGIAMAVISGGMAARLWPTTGELRWPVMVYIGAILTMGAAALVHAGGLVAAGALSFMISDTILAADRFLLKPNSPGRQFAGPAVWVTYFAAQVLILFGVLAVPLMP